MAINIADRVKETSSTTGTGTLTLLGAAAGYRAFSAAFTNGDLVPYFIVDGTAWEVGLGTYSAGTLARTVVYKSSNANALVALSANVKDVVCTMPAEHMSAVRVHDGVSADPAVTDDGTKGYVAYQSTWTLQNGESWACYDASTGAAIWKAFAPVSIRAAAGSNYSFKFVGGHFNGMAPDQCVSMTDAAAAFDHTYGTPLNSGCAGGYGFRTFWGLSTGVGFGFTSGASTSKVDSGAQGTTTNATPTLVYPDAIADASWYVPLNGITEFTVKVVAWDNTAKIGKTWSLVGTVKRGASGAATFIGSVTKTVLQADGGAAAWDVGLTIANTGTSASSALNLTVTGAAATTIEWGAGITATQLAMW